MMALKMAGKDLTIVKIVSILGFPARRAINAYRHFANAAYHSSKTIAASQ
jgi:hypothetical protein